MDALLKVEKSSGIELQRLLPAFAKDDAILAELDAAKQNQHSMVDLRTADARKLSHIGTGAADLIVTSPPYWNIKDYGLDEGQIGAINHFEEFLESLEDSVKEMSRVLIPGGRACIVIGDVTTTRSSQVGRHKSFPIHAHIQIMAEKHGLDCLTPILWYKMNNATSALGTPNKGMMGKPFEPGGIVKSDVEFILLLRKPGKFRHVPAHRRALSLLSAQEYRESFTQIWTNIGGERGNSHPAAFPVELARRLIRMFSFVGDTVVDPFLGSGSTAIAAREERRHIVGSDINSEYVDLARTRIP